ncbi:hypothetical protein ABB37_05286 [Leptomonas pyrrhocoris]|uniref:Uncharacterized protein n=1 Tax=Leptomonas pyrrhocoris TaxID=157538 RepID=A0A0N0DUW5_LEPPY|nr:hypothetical protein ABB37_05286 [Leptomonas pyrrhocoris]KPA79448.1 hypothetical protein ABB37_05286 [Leptomonas pyrrhocoris]|eukprot:XP_015657887.1 hypothetical protein ABB37_05286 [Leptomonas pyrrhocoris]
MSTAGQVVYSSTSRSPISVSSSSASSFTSAASLSAPSSPRWRAPYTRSGNGTAKQSSHVPRVSPRDTGGDRCDVSSNGFVAPLDVESTRHGPCVLVYVTPSTAHQFVSLSSAAGFLQQQRQQRVLPSSSSPLLHNGTRAAERRLTGGYWHLGYAVCSSREVGARRHASSLHTCWCFTLEPLPSEQLELCRTLLQPQLDTSPSQPSQPSRTPTPAHRTARQTPEQHHQHSHHHRHHHHDSSAESADPRLHDLLVTPLYVCTNKTAVVELDVDVFNTLPGALIELSQCTAGWSGAQADAALHSLLQHAPSSAALVYALRQRRRFCLPLLQLIRHDNFGETAEEEEAGVCPSGDVGVEVYVTLGGASAAWTAERTAADGPERDAPSFPSDAAGGDAGCPPPLSSMTRRVVMRCGQMKQQTIVFQGCPSAAAHLRRGAVVELMQTTRACTTSSRMLTTMQAALRLLDALTPSADGQEIMGRRRNSVVTNALDLYVQREVPSMKEPLRRVAGGQVRRAVAAVAADSCAGRYDASTLFKMNSKDGGVVPEPDVMTFPWFTSRSSGSAGTDTSAAAQNFPPETDVQRRRSVPSRVTPSDIDACMRELDVSADLLTHVHDLTHAILHLSSLTFSPRHGTASTAAAAASVSAAVTTTSEAALLAAVSIPACDAASSLLHVPPLELVQLLTTVEVRTDGGAVRHALNCAGACQLQSVLVAQLGGVLVRTVLHAVNGALQRDGGCAGDGEAGSGDKSAPLSPFSVISLVVNASGDATSSASTEKADEEGADSSNVGGGLQDWYAAYTELHVQSAVCARLIGTLRQEARCEGVEREVDTWIDQINSGADGASSCYAPAVAEAVELAKRVRLPDHTFGALAAPRTSSSPSLMHRLAEVIDSVVARCGGSDAASCPSTPAAVQQLLRDALHGLVAEAAEEGGNEGASILLGGADRTPTSPENGRHQQGHMARRLAHPATDVKLVWASPTHPSEDGGNREAASASNSSAQACLCLSWPSGLHPPLRLSLARMAVEVLASVRLSKIGATAAVQRVVGAAATRSASLLSRHDAAASSSNRVESGKRADKGLPQEREPMSAASASLSVTQALCETLTLHRPDEGSAAVNAVQEDGTHNCHALTLVHAIPVSSAQARQAVTPPRHPFLEPVVPPLSPSAASTPQTVDDAVFSYLWVSQPLWLALFYWSRLCHTHVCPVVPFGRDWAVPLLTAYAVASAAAAPRTPVRPSGSSWISSSSTSPQQAREETPSPSRERRLLSFSDTPTNGADAHLRRRVRALHEQARYRELALLALSTLPFCRSAVLGVSRVFLPAATAEEMTRWRAELRAAAARRVQRVGRAFLARRRFVDASQRARQASMSATGIAGSSPRVLTPAELRSREELEQQREVVLRQTSQQRACTLDAAAANFGTAVRTLQRSWIATLELLESELVGATTEINSFETQRRAAEDAARQEARTQARVTAEAWAEAWEEEEAREQHHRRTAQQLARLRHRPCVSPKEPDSAARVQEEERLARITTRHLSRLRRTATQRAEAALLARAVAKSQDSDAAWLARHVRRQEQRLTREAELREEQLQQQQQSWQHVGGRANKAHTSIDTAVPTATPERSSNRGRDASTSLQYSDARGLVFTRPRPIAREAVRRPAPQRLDPIHAGAPRNGTEEEKSVDGVSVASIDRTVLQNLTRSAAGEDEEWAVQRDLMSLWESSRLTT